MSSDLRHRLHDALHAEHTDLVQLAVRAHTQGTYLRRRRRIVLASGSIAMLTLLAVGVASALMLLPGPREARPATGVAGPGEATITAGPFTFAAPPEGWSVQHAHSSGVIFAPAAGGVDDDPHSYVGKLVFYLENTKQRGEHLSFDGRDFWVRHSQATENSGAYTMISTSIRSRDSGSLTVQYPDSTGLTQKQIVDFLATVEVGPDAQLTGG